MAGEFVFDDILGANTFFQVPGVAVREGLFGKTRAVMRIRETFRPVQSLLYLAGSSIRP
jgi:hypothetical protein